MKQRSKIGFAVVVLALIGGCWLLFGPSNEPKYEGRPVSYWFRQGYVNDSDYDESELREAFKKMGTNALPYLVGEALSTNQDSAFKTNYYKLLEKLPDSWGMPQLVSSDDIRDSAVEAIGTIDFSAKDILPLLAKALQETNTLSHKQAISILSNIVTNDDESLVPYFVKALHDVDPDVQLNSLLALGKMGPAARMAVPDLIELLRSPQNKNKIYTDVSILGNIRGEAAPAIPYLKEMFEKETDWWLRGTLARSLCQIDRQQDEALDFLVNVLKETNAPSPIPVRSISNPVGIFKETRPSPDEILENIGPFKHSAFAAAQLGLIGSNALPAVPALIKKLEESDAGTELSVISIALKKIGASSESILPILKQKLAFGDDLTRLGAAREIIYMVPGDREAQSLLISAIRDHSRYEVGAIIYLGWTGTNALADAIQGLMGVFDESKPDNWSFAATALKNIHAPQDFFMPKLKEKLKSPSDSIQYKTDFIILDIDPTDQDAVLNLTELVRKNSVDTESAIDALGEAGSAAREAIPALKEALKNNDKDIRKAARSALRKIQAKEGAK